jgi:hypothetical protein
MSEYQIWDLRATFPKRSHMQACKHFFDEDNLIKILKSFWGNKKLELNLAAGVFSFMYYYIIERTENLYPKFKQFDLFLVV